MSAQRVQDAGPQREHAAGARVEVAGRLVGEHAGRLGHPRAREGAALALAAGELARLVLEARSQADFRQELLCLLERKLLVHSADEKRHADVFRRGELHQQVMELVDEAEGAVAHLAALGLAQGEQRPALDQHRARARRVEPAQKMQQRRLARAGAPHDRDPLARIDVEVDAEEHRDRGGSLISLLQVTTGKYRLTHTAGLRRDSRARRASSGRGWRRTTARAPSARSSRRRPPAGPKAARESGTRPWTGT